MTPEEKWLFESFILALIGGALVMLIYLNWNGDE